MSHVYSIETVFNDVDAIEATCVEMGLKFKRGQKTYAWWGRSVGDYPVPKGMKAEDLGKCEHAIGVPGTTWEIGLVKIAGEDGYRMVFDFFGSQGHPILEAIGDADSVAALRTGHDRSAEQRCAKGSRFVQLYGVNKVTLDAKKLGHHVVRNVQPGGKIDLKITGRLSAGLGRAE